MRAFFISAADAITFDPPFASLVFFGARSFNPRFAAGWPLALFPRCHGIPPWDDGAPPA
jgi:hypothetical protein